MFSPWLGWYTLAMDNNILVIPVASATHGEPIVCAPRQFKDERDAIVFVRQVLREGKDWTVWQWDGVRFIQKVVNFGMDELE